ncbi:MAG: HYR domain-containing protein [Planctomycetes bacterium]|nr:HYR domain-containing protein [Planctomycetota bacterium]
MDLPLWQRSVIARSAALALLLANSAFGAGFVDDFESYQPGAWPSSWIASGNSNGYIDNSVSYQGTQAFRLYGIPGAAWSTHAFHPLGAQAPYEIEVAVRTGNEFIPDTGHQYRAVICNWDMSVPGTYDGLGRWLMAFHKNGTIYGAGGALCTYQPFTWYLVKIRYERPSASEARWTCWVNGAYETSVTLDALPYEDTLTYLNLVGMSGTVWYDAVRVTGIAVEPPPGPPEPSAGKIVFERGEVGSREICIMNPDGTGLLNLTQNPAEDKAPTPSPDGRWIAFVSNRDGRQDIWVMRPDGSGLTKITTDGRTVMSDWAFPIAWSPDSRTIAVSRYRLGSPGKVIQVATLEGEVTEILAADGWNDEGPMWSPAGDKVTFSSDLSNRNGWFGTYRVNPDGTGLQAISSSSPMEIYACWRPDAAAIVFSRSADCNTPATFMIMNPDGSNKRVVCQSGLTQGGAFAWSPDMQTIAFSFWNPSQQTYSPLMGGVVGIMDAVGANLRYLTPMSGADAWLVRALAWSPDGTRFCFASNEAGEYHIYTVSREGTGKTNVTANIGGPCRHPAWFKVPNTAPIANAGPDQTVEQTSAAGTQVTLYGSGSSDPDGDPLTYQWTWPGGSATGVRPTVTLPLGTTTVTLVVNDGQADSDPDTVDITVEDKTPPELVVPSPIVVEQATGDGTRVEWECIAADICDAEVDVMCVPPSGSVFPLGVTTVTCTATDDSGNQTVRSFTVTVRDTTAPVIESAWATPNVLWPPNHKMADVAVGAVVGDICDAAPSWKIVGVASNEPVNGLGDGDTAPDWAITVEHSLKLRAERSGKGSGRVYTITIQATDASGNTATANVVVTVPHDRKK